MPDATVVGAGPNGLAAAITLSRAGLDVELYEASLTPGGGVSSSELTLPGFTHDRFSAVYPFLLASPFFRDWSAGSRIPLLNPRSPFGHAFSREHAILVDRDIDSTAARLGESGGLWKRVLLPLLDDAEGVFRTTLGTWSERSVRTALRVAASTAALRSAAVRTNPAVSVFTGLMAHAGSHTPSFASAGVALVLALAGHVHGWPLPRGGAQTIAAAMVKDFSDHGGRVFTGHLITDLRELPPSRAVLLDTSTRALARIASSRLPDAYLRRLHRYRYGDAVFKVDLAVSQPVPWVSDELATTPTVHLESSENDSYARGWGSLGRDLGGEPAPFVLLVQPGVVDPTRAPSGAQTVWAYCRVPAGSTLDMTERIVSRIEHFAPGFRDTILAISTRSPMQLEAENPNLVGGDINGGLVNIGQILARPTMSPNPWRTPSEGIYLCSSSTFPGSGVHGMGGYNAARLALRETFRLGPPLME